MPIDNRKACRATIVLLGALSLLCAGTVSAAPPGGMVHLLHDGAWCWFEDERAIIDDGKLIVGTVADGRTPDGSRDESRRGHIEATVFDLREMKLLGTTLLHANLQGDDHDSPAFLVRPDGHILTAYAKHGPENVFYYRVSTRPHDATQWQEEKTCRPTETSRVTYSNLHYLSAENDGKGRIYNFFRGLDNSFKPSYVYSDDLGETWSTGSVFIRVPATAKHRPYVKYASNGVDTVHIFYTEGHPRNFDNSVYHVFYRDGMLRRSDGSAIRSLKEGLERPEEGTRIFEGDADNVAWTCDIAIDANGNPYVAYSVQKNSAGLPPRQGGEDHRYRYARWDGSRWIDQEIAYAGSKLYAGEDDYTGNVALDPDDPSTVCISTNVDPATGEPLASGHYEIFRGKSTDAGATWQWTPVTEDSQVDNLRPIIPASADGFSALLWLRGTYKSYTDYDLDVVGLLARDE